MGVPEISVGTVMQKEPYVYAFLRRGAALNLPRMIFLLLRVAAPVQPPCLAQICGGSA